MRVWNCIGSYLPKSIILGLVPQRITRWHDASYIPMMHYGDDLFINLVQISSWILHHYCLLMGPQRGTSGYRFILLSLALSVLASQIVKLSLRSLDFKLLVSMSAYVLHLLLPPSILSAQMFSSYNTLGEILNFGPWNLIFHTDSFIALGGG